MSDPTESSEQAGVTFHKVLDLDELPEGRVTTVNVGHQTFAVTHHDGEYGCLDNKCPHQGGPLGEGSIENGHLRCPWHGYDYDPTSGKPPPPFDDAPACFTTEVRQDGVYVAIPTPEPKQRTASDVLVETMVNWGVSAVFGMVGHSNLGIADAMRHAEERNELRFFGIRHEGAAAFAASAFGKLTGKPGACFGIAGPGSTNMLTGLYDAKVDRAPVLAISGQVPSNVRGRGAFQDVDLAGAFNDVSAYSQTLFPQSDHGEITSIACKTAIVQRDVAHLIVPDDVQTIPSDREAMGPEGRVADRRFAPPSDVVTQAVDRLRSAKRPLFIVGAGARNDMSEIVSLAESIGAPVATTFKAKGQISDHHALGCGVLGRSGTPVASWFMNESDLIVVFGASFSNHTGISSYKPIIQIDDDPQALGRFHPVDIPMLGNASVTAKLLTDQLNSGAMPGQTEPSTIDHRPEVAERWAIWRAEKTSRTTDDKGQGVGAASIFESMSELADPNAVICIDVGNNAYSFGRYFEVENQTVLMSGYLGSIGFALPAAMGAWAAVGDSRQIISVSGDGGLGQYAMELSTLAKYGMNITHVLLDNNELGKISKEQRAADFDVWQTSLHNPNFAELATLMGIEGLSVDSTAQLGPVLSQALQHRGPSLVAIQSDVELL